MKRTVAVSINWISSPLRILSVPILSLWLAATALGQCSGLGFNAAINIEAAAAPQHLAAGDFNGDGKTDLVFPSAADTVSVFMGQATGLPVRVPVSVQAPRDVGVGDFNHDGKLDLVVTRTPAFNQTFLTILLGNGSGGFGAATDFAATLTNPLVVADFNNDTNLDVFLGSGSFGGSQILLGNGSGGFAAPINADVAGNSSAVARDFNNDGKIDLALVNGPGGPNSVFLALGNGNGGFGPSNSFPVSNPRFVSAADFNSDGKLDVVVAGQADGVSVLLGDGAGNLGAAASFSTGGSTNTVIAADFNGDSKADVLATGGIFVSLFTGDGNGNLTGRKEYRVNQVPVAVATGDLNGDGARDVFFADQNPMLPPLNGTLPALGGTIMFGDGAGNMRSANVINGASAFAVASGDLNGDGRPDLVSVNIGGNSVAVSLANSSGFNAPTNVTVGNQPRSVSLADLNGDQKLDLVTANFNGNSASVLLGDGFGGFGALTNLPVSGFGPQYVTTGDFNQDGNPDLIVAYLNSSFVTVLPGNGAGGFGTAITSATPTGASQLAIGDFNSDGKPDISLAVIGGLSILLGNGNGGFGAANTFATTASVIATAVGDLNGDGNSDATATIVNNNQLLIYLGNGQGGFTLSATLSIAGGPSGIALADYNGDGTVDVATGNTDGTTSVFLGNGNGTFAAAVSYPVGGGVTRALITTDFDLDGRADLAFANQGNSGSGTQPSSLSIIYNVCSMIPPALPTLSVSDATVTEGDSGNVNATFDVTLSAASSKTVSVSFYPANLDAARAVDYQNVSGRLTFAPGTTTQVITIPVIGDTLDEFDEQFNVLLSNPLNATLTKSRGVGLIIDNDPPPAISIGDTLLVEGNSGTATATFVLTLSAASGKPITVQYATQDGTANAGSDYVQKSTSVVLQPGTVSTIVTVTVNGDTGIEPDETFFVNLTGPVNVTIAQPQAKCIIIADDNGSGNPIDLVGFFVRQHYRDFLGREPDVSGFEFWRNQIASCGSDVQCNEVRRIDVSASFFLSIEFQNNGYLVERFYKVAYGNATGNSTFGGAHQLSVPVVRFNEFLQGTQRIGQGVIVLAPGWEQLLENNKQGYALEFVQTSRFITAFPTNMTPTEFVDKLNANAGNVLSATERTTAINSFSGAANSSNTTARAQAVRQVAEDTDLYNAESNRAFVLAEYFGYLRRNPNDAPESTLDYTGYDFWLTKLNQFNGNYINAEMVRAFLSSIEYRQRFGP